MAFANPSISDIVATTIDSRSKVVADSVRDNNALLTRLNTRGKIKFWNGGGPTIVQEVAFQDNSTVMYYSGSEVLNISPSDVLSGAQYTPKQAAGAVVMTGLEELMNTGQ